MASFLERLAAAGARNRSLVCVGLDPVQARMPEAYRKMDAADAARDFSLAAVDATRDLACAFKPNAGFFEQYGPEGVAALRDVVRHARSTGVPVVLDAKRGDIGSTAEAYARAAFDALGADAVTVSPYMGEDSLEPFFARRDRGVFVLCRTSNPGGRDFQETRLEDGALLFERVAERAREWHARSGNVGLVVGATVPEELRRVRAIVGDALPLLIPGVGAQGGSAEDAVRLGANSRGELALVNASRAVLYAGDASPAAQRAACEALRDELNRYQA